MGILDRLTPAKRGKTAKPAAVNPLPDGSFSSQGQPEASTPPGVIRDAQGRITKGSAPLHRAGRPKGIEAELREAMEREGPNGSAHDKFARILSGELEVDNRLWWEAYRWSQERANGRALERSQNVNVALGQGEAAPLPFEKLSTAARRELIEAIQEQAALPAGDVVDVEFKAQDLPSTDPVTVTSDKAQ
jgi:hypothetical protein